MELDICQITKSSFCDTNLSLSVRKPHGSKAHNDVHIGSYTPTEFVCSVSCSEDYIHLFLPSLIVLFSPLYPVVFLPGLEMENLLHGLVPVAGEADASVVKIYIGNNLSLLGTRRLMRVVVDVIKTDVILL